MAHIAADGSKWSNAAQARKVPGRAQGDGKQPVTKFSKPEPARAATADPVSATSDTSATDAPHGGDQSAPTVEVTQDGNTFVVTAKFASADEAHAAAQQLAGGDQGEGDSSPVPHDMNPSQAMM